MCGTGTWPWPATVVGFVICDGEILGHYNSQNISKQCANNGWNLTKD